MLKEATYKEKFLLLDAWLPAIIETVKKDLKNEHLKQDFGFAKKYFSNKNLNKLTTEELAEGYRQALAQEETAESLAEFISNRWLIKHGDVYHFFEEQLKRIYPNFTEIKELDLSTSTQLMEAAIDEFGAPQTYLFTVINSVVFPKTVLEQLQKRAMTESKQQETQAQQDSERLSVEMIQQNSQQQIARLTDKYEKKLQGLQKKYIQDTEMLKKQIATLQRKLNAAS